MPLEGRPIDALAGPRRPRVQGSGGRGINILALMAQGAAAVAFVIAFWTDQIGLGAALAGAVLALSIRLTAPLACINFITVYWYITFIVTPPLLVPQMVPTLQFHYAAIQGLISAAYWIRRIAGSRLDSRDAPEATRKGSGSRVRFSQVLTLLFLLFAALLGIQIAATGFSAWFSGAGAAERISQYANLNATEALTRNGSLIIAWGFVGLYIVHRRWDVRFTRTSQALAFVGVPLLSIARSLFVFNVLFLAMSNRRVISPVVLAAGFASMMIVGLGFGLLRSSSLAEGGDNMAVTEILTSEFSSSIVYSDLINYGDEIGLKYGVPIIAPVIFAPIPHFMWPGKPDNGSAVYMKHFHPDMLEAGYSYASNCLSDAFLNFGYFGIGALAIALGWIFAKVDWRVETGSMTPLDYLLVFNIYTLLRTALAVTIMFVILQLVIVWLLERYVVSRKPARPRGLVDDGRRGVDERLGGPVTAPLGA